MTKVARTNVGPIAVLTLSRPPVNAMDLTLTEEIGRSFRSITGDKAVRAVVLTGEGNSFCAGLDLKIVPTYKAEKQRRLLHALNEAFLSVYSCPVPVVGAINGHAIAGGFVLALCCDWRIAGDVTFQIGLTEARVGIPYPVVAMEVVRNELPRRMTRELVLFGQNMTSAAACAAGIFDRSAPQQSLIEEALKKASAAAELPRLAFEKIKRQLRNPTLAACEAAVGGKNDPLRDAWLSEETVAGASRVLRGSST